MKLELFTTTIIVFVSTVGISLSISAHAYGQLSEYIDPEDPYNLTKLCNQYISIPRDRPDPEGIMQCVPYLNDTMLDRYGIPTEMNDESE